MVVPISNQPPERPTLGDDNRSTVWATTPDCSVVQRDMSQIEFAMHAHLMAAHTGRIGGASGCFLQDGRMEGLQNS